MKYTYLMIFFCFVLCEYSYAEDLDITQFKVKINALSNGPEKEVVKKINKIIDAEISNKNIKALTPETDPLGFYGISVDAGFGRLKRTNHMTKTITVRYDLTNWQKHVSDIRAIPNINIWGGYGLDNIESSTSTSNNPGHPYLAGVGLGFGSFTGGNTSVINIDIGLGFYEGIDWSKNKEYFYGLSIDARLLGKLLQSLGAIKFE